MNDAVPAAPEHDSPAFLRAVADLSEQQPVSTSQAIFNAQGVKLLEGGVRVDQGLYDRLVSHRLSKPLDECVEAEPTIDAKVLRETATAVMERWPFFARLGASAFERDELLKAVAGVSLPKPLALHLTLARKTRPALFEHSVMMAMLCSHLVRKAEGVTRDAVMDAAAAGLLHDIGMLHIDPALLDADERLSGQRLNPVYVHPLTASMLIDRFDMFSGHIGRAVVEHHERMDGSGYPRGLVGESISPLGRVLALAEVVTAMFDGERERPEDRVSLLLRINPRRYDPKAVSEVQRLLGPVAGGEAGAELSHSIERLLGLSELLAAWREAAGTLAESLGPAHRSLLESLNEQNATLQRMLYDAGVTPDQLQLLRESEGQATSKPAPLVGTGGGGAAPADDSIVDLLEDDGDAAMRIELWALAEELLWQLHSAANQLKRRWRAAEPKLEHPPALAAWLTRVAALPESPKAAKPSNATDEAAAPESADPAPEPAAS